MIELNSVRISPLAAFETKFASDISRSNFGEGDDFVVIRLYSGGNLIYSFQTTDFDLDNNYVLLDLARLLESNQIISGIFDMEIQGFRWVNKSPLLVDETSANEVRLYLRDTTDSSAVNNFLAFQNYDQTELYYHQFTLLEDGTSFNTYPITGKFVDAITRPNFPYSVICRLGQSPDPDTEIYRIVEQIFDPVLVQIKVVPDFVSSQRLLRPFRPDFFARTNASSGETTDYLSWNEILDSPNESDKQKILDATVSKSFYQENLSIDYGSWHNFVKFSSARKRLEVFWDKLEDIEFFASKSFAASGAYAFGAFSVSAGVTSSFVGSQDYQYWEQKRYDVFSTFDGYEKYLYFESGSKSFPKTTVSKPHTLYSISSSEATAWRETWYESSSFFDQENSTNLIKTVPFYVLEDSGSTEYVTFVQMIGHYFDQIYEYIDGLNRTTKRTEKYAVPPKLLYDVASGYAWKLASGFDNDKLEEFYLGKINGSFYRGDIRSQTGEQLARQGYSPSVAGETLRDEIWQRVVNTLPYIYETKGTLRSARSFINTYGIPSTILRVNEYGVQDDFSFTSSFHQYERSTADVFFNSTNTVTIADTPNTVKTVEFRLKVPSSYSSSWPSNVTQSIWSLIDLAVAVTPTSGVYADIGFSDNGGVPGLVNGLGLISPTMSLPILDDNLWNYSIRYDSGTASLSVGRKDAEGNVPYFTQVESTSSVASESFLHTTGNGAFMVLLTSQSFNEYRQWNEYLPNDVLLEHIRNPFSLEGATLSSSYYGLHRHFKMFSDTKASTLGDVTYSSHINPDLGPTENQLVFGSSAYTFNRFTEDVFVRLPYSIGENLDSNKIRCISSSLPAATGSVFHPDRTVITSSDFPRGSDKVSIGFNPAYHQNIHLANIFGELDLAQYVSPNDQYSASYSEMNLLREIYTETLQYQVNLNGFLRALKLFDASLFDQIKKLLPARAVCDVGYTIEPMFFERPKLWNYSRPSASWEVKSGSISPQEEIVSMSYEGFYDVTHSIFADDGFDQRYSGSRYIWDNYIWELATGSSTNVKLDISDATFSVEAQSNAVSLVVAGVPYEINTLTHKDITLNQPISLVSASNWFLQFGSVASETASNVTFGAVTTSNEGVSGTLQSNAYVSPVSFEFTSYDQGNATVPSVWQRVTYVSGLGQSPLLDFNGDPTASLDLVGLETSSMTLKVSNGTLDSSVSWPNNIEFLVEATSGTLEINPSPIALKPDGPPWPIMATAGTLSYDGVDYDIVKRISNTEIQIDTDLSYFPEFLESIVTYTSTGNGFTTGTISAGTVLTQSSAVRNVRWRESLLPTITASVARPDLVEVRRFESGGVFYSSSEHTARVSTDNTLQGYQNRFFNGTSLSSSILTIPSGTTSPLTVWTDPDSGIGFYFNSSSQTYDNGPVIQVFNYPDVNQILITGN